MLLHFGSLQEGESKTVSGFHGSLWKETASFSRSCLSWKLVPRSSKKTHRQRDCRGWKRTAREQGNHITEQLCLNKKERLSQYILQLPSHQGLVPPPALHPPYTKYHYLTWPNFIARPLLPPIFTPCHNHCLRGEIVPFSCLAPLFCPTGLQLPSGHPQGHAQHTWRISCLCPSLCYAHSHTFWCDLQAPLTSGYGCKPAPAESYGTHLEHQVPDSELHSDTVRLTVSPSSVTYHMGCQEKCCDVFFTFLLALWIKHAILFFFKYRDNRIQSILSKPLLTGTNYIPLF